MTKQAKMMNDKKIVTPLLGNFVIRGSSFLRPSSFELRHFS